MQLVNEQDDISCLLDLLDDRLEALLKLAPIFGARYHPGEVELDHALPEQGFGDLGGEDLLSQSLDDGRLANPGLADENRVILRPPRQDLNHPFNLCMATDHRIQLPLTCHTGQVQSKLVKGGRPRGARPLVALLA